MSIDVKGSSALIVLMIIRTAISKLNLISFFENYQVRLGHFAAILENLASIFLNQMTLKEMGNIGSIPRAKETL